MIQLRPAQQRGHVKMMWLDTWHSFSFGSYYDPDNTGYSALRVINDDTINPASGFDTHSHQNMEIITFVTEGVIEHKDSLGNTQRLPEGEFQLMSAGAGIAHSEYNASDDTPLSLLQIWIKPNLLNTTPGYQQKDFGKEPGLTPIVTPDGENGTLLIKQNAQVFQVIVEPNQSVKFKPKPDRHLYVHQADARLSINQIELSKGDGAIIEDEQLLCFTNNHSVTATALLFDLP